MNVKQAIFNPGGIVVAMYGILRGFANGPWVLLQLVSQRLGMSHDRDIEIITHRGSRITTTKNGVIGPAEVFGLDVYHLAQLVGGSTRADLHVVDVGAHVGSFTIAVLERCPQAQCSSYEPSPDTFRYLERNVHANGLASHTKVVQAAVGGVAGWATLWEAEKASGVNSLIPSEMSRPVEVTVVTLDQVIKQVGRRIDILKIDCEGSEFAILRNASMESLQAVERIVMEYHVVQGHDIQSITKRLAEAGLKCSNRTGHIARFERMPVCGSEECVMR
ncbi:MAG: FkbM family methyltransferase [Thermaerobacter sp.]|nr:FkbM family methyltransferase [Thermaerobacter sp.]